MKEKAILYVYGNGGHKAQMKRLIERLDIKKNRITFLGIAEKGYELDIMDKNYIFFPFRDKYSIPKTVFFLPYTVIKLILVVFWIFLKYDCRMLISTGPGLVVIPSIIFRLLNKKIVFIETWSRFYTKSSTGKVMEYISDEFIIQNRELEDVYENSEYGGRL